MENAVEEQTFQTCDNDNCQRHTSRIQRNAFEFQMKSSETAEHQVGDQFESCARTDRKQKQTVEQTVKALKKAQKLKEDISKDKVSNSPGKVELIHTEREKLLLGSDTANENRDKCMCEECRSPIHENSSQFQVNKVSEVGKKATEDQIQCSTRTNDNLLLPSLITSCYVNIHRKLAERIICTQGCQIQHLEKNSGADIMVIQKKSESKNITLRITGRVEARKKAIKLIEDMTKDKVSNSRGEIQSILMERDKPFLGSDTANENHDECMCEECMSRIQENSSQSQVNKISKVGKKAAEDQIACDMRANDNLLQISEITSCYVEIHNNLAEKIIGIQGCKIQHLEKESGAEIMVVDKKDASHYTKLLVTGTDKALKNTKRLIEKLSNPKVKYCPDKTEYHARSSNNLLQTSEITSCYVEIHNNLAEKIIGIQGCKIQHLEKKSGAEIMVVDKRDASHYTKLLVTGTDKALKNTKRLIEKLSNPKVKYCTGKTETSFPPIIKDFYKEDRIVASMTNEEVDYFRYCNFIFVNSRDPQHYGRIPKPVTSFKQAFQHYPELLEQIIKQGFTLPSQIQCQAWPIIMKGYDMIGISPAETGKTLAVLFPALIHIKGQATTNKDRIGPSVLILTPTKEDVQRIYGEVRKYMYFGIKSICIYDRCNEKYDMKHVDLLITTPEHMYDEDMNNTINITGVTFLVLDSAIQMSKFKSQLRKLAVDINPNRQIICLCRVWMRRIKKLFSWFRIKPINVVVTQKELLKTF